MLINPLDIELGNTYKAGEAEKDYLVKNGFPLLAIVGNSFYFTESQELRVALEKMPFKIRLLNWLGK